MRLSLSLMALCSLLVAAAACAKKTDTVVLYTPYGAPALQVDLSYAADAAATCGTPASWLLRLETTLEITAGENAGWDYTLLFDSTRTTLYGCGSPSTPCTSALLVATFGSLSRVMVEGLSVAPELFAGSTQGVDVLCRGVADVAVDPAAIAVASPGDTPAPAPSPTSYPSPLFVVTAKMLRVGAANPLPFAGVGAVPPQVRYGAAASFSDTQHGIGLVTGSNGGGAVALGGGKGAAGFPDSVWIFQPGTLAFSEGGSLGGGRLGVSASTFFHPPTVNDPAGAPGVLFAGGANAGASQTASAAIVRENGEVALKTMQVPRAFAQLVLIPRNGAGLPGASNWRVALFGSAPWDDDGSTISRGPMTYEYYDPGDSGTVDNGCNVDLFCRPNLNEASPGLRAAAVAHPGAGGGGVWVLSPDPPGGLHTRFVSDMFTTNADPFDLPVSASSSILFQGSGAKLDGAPVLFGGLTAENTANATARVAAIDIGVSSANDFDVGSMLEPRGEARAVLLRDHTVLIIGGRNTAAPTGLSTVERMVMTGTEATQAAFEPAGALLAARFGHTATRLEQTGTWLDGAVLVWGGGGGSAPAAELYVPAMTCQGLDPVGPFLLEPADPSTMPGPPLCDRNRSGEPITLQ